MNEGLLSELGHKFNASLSKDDSVEMDWGFGSGREEERHRGGAGEVSRAKPEPSRDGLAQPLLSSDFKALQRKPVKMCQSLEVSVAWGRPPTRV